MADMLYARLESRAVVAVEGADARDFLQGLVSNDVDRLGPAAALYAALLTPQGKYLFDFFLAQSGDAVWLDVEAGRAPDLVKRLSMYKLRSKVTITPRDDVGVAALFGDIAPLDIVGAGAAKDFAGGVAFVDPRLATAGARLLAPTERLDSVLADLGARAVSADDYDSHRLALGLADGSRDIQIEKSTLLEANFEELHGVDFKKGCYVGQEVTARTKYRGLVKKRLVPVTIDGPVPAAGTAVTDAEGREVGTLHSAQPGIGLALLRLEQLDASALRAGEATISPRKPAWIAA
ncbi:MAG: folate-binding protein [Alphaproteobacteria bacterium]